MESLTRDVGFVKKGRTCASSLLFKSVIEGLMRAKKERSAILERELQILGADGIPYRFYLYSCVVYPIIEMSMWNSHNTKSENVVQIYPNGIVFVLMYLYNGDNGKKHINIIFRELTV